MDPLSVWLQAYVQNFTMYMHKKAQCIFEILNSTLLLEMLWYESAT